MSTNYCPNCGNKIESTGVKANFCPKCGQNLNSLKINASKVDNEEIDDTNEVLSEGNLDLSAIKDKIKISIDIDKTKPITVGEILQQAKASGPEGNRIEKRPPVKLPKGKALLKAIQDECRSSKNTSSEVA